MDKGKPVLGFRVDRETVQWLNEYTQRTGKSKSDVFKESITLFRKERDLENLESN